NYLRQYKTPSKWYNEHQVLNRRCFCMGKNVYSSETKWAVVKAKMEGELTTNEIMEKYGIKNKSQISTRVRWYKQGELQRFDHPLGTQYTYGHGPGVRPDDERRHGQTEH